MKSSLQGVVVGVVFTAGAFSAHADVVDPRGVYFHRFVGSGFSGVEWVTMLENPGERRYEFSDIRAITPFSGTISEDGVIDWDAGAVRGSGQFSDPDSATFTGRFGAASFTSILWRAPRTTPDFITELESPEVGRAALAGEYRVTIEDLHPQTGAVVGSRVETMILDVVGRTLRLTDGDGDYVQGVFEDDGAVGFRVVSPNAARGRYNSFDGSETNRLLNLMGDLRFAGDDAFTATMLLQTRQGPGSQTQFVEHYTAVRVPTPATSLVIVAAGAVGSRPRRSNS